MIVGTTGHRLVPEQKAGDLDRFARLFVAQSICAGATEMITGMAVGWDTAVALACCELNVPFRAYIPFKGQERLWPEEARSLYINLLCDAKEIKIVGGFPDTGFFLERNKWIVRDCHELGSFWNGGAGGTQHCTLYAKQVERKVRPLWEDWIRFQNERKN